MHYYYYVFCVTFCGLKSQSHSDDGRVHATVPCSVCVFATMSCIPLVIYIYINVYQTCGVVSCYIRSIGGRATIQEWGLH